MTTTEPKSALIGQLQLITHWLNDVTLYNFHGRAQTRIVRAQHTHPRYRAGILDFLARRAAYRQIEAFFQFNHG